MSQSVKRQPGQQGGFTIVELLIATLVFSMILIVVTAGVLRFTRQYYRGVIANSTQNTARSIIDDVARSIQFNAGDVYPLTSNDPAVAPVATAAPKGYCIGDAKRYSFARNRQVTQNGAVAANHQSRYGLVSDTISGCSRTTRAINAATLTNIAQTNDGVPLQNSRELLGEHMRINKFEIDGADGIYTITVRVIYGDDALLCSPSAPGECNPGGTASNASLDNKSDLTCRSMSGAQFCAVSELSTTVKREVN